MKKLLYSTVVALVAVLSSCSNCKTPKKQFHLNLHFLGGHTKDVWVTLPIDTYFYITSMNGSYWIESSSNNSGCGGTYFAKQAVVDFEILPDSH